jgi:hypothetical protein
VGINEAGLDLLKRMSPVVTDLQVRITRHVPEEDLRRLSELLEKLRTDQRI